MKDDELAKPGDGPRGTGPGSIPGLSSGTSAGEGLSPLASQALGEAGSGLAPLSLSLIDPPRLLYERTHEPSEDSPILYRERAYLVDNLQSDEELEEQLQSELAAIREELRDRDTSQFVQLALFDHEFEDQPSSPPVATLSWKDWQGRSEVWVRGVRRSSAPPPDDAALHAGAVERSRPGERWDASGANADVQPASESLPLGSSPREDESAATSERQLVEGAKKRSDSGTSWQAPSRSGEYRIPEAEELASPAPSSEQVLASEAHVAELFESMSELVYAGNIADGAAFVRDVIAKQVQCDGALIHVLDSDARELVVVRALGPNSRAVVALRAGLAASHIAEALGRGALLELDPSETPSLSASWRALGVDPALVLCAPLRHAGRQLGAIEVGRVTARPRFNAAERTALEYIAEQFADFVAERPLLVDDDAIAEPQ